MGLIILAFFLSGKKTSCSYGPDARVIKNISQKKIAYTNVAQTFINNNNLDSLAIKTILQSGNVNFSKSNARQEPCGLYLIESRYKDKNVELFVENCDSLATVTNFNFIIP